ncbi:MAG: hypothetical protein NVS9B12_11510 [Vulcanimicrobiaceae bacterium]
MSRFGERILLDYGDWAGFDVPEANVRRILRTDAMRARHEELRAKYDVIHGHFIADKYIGLFPVEDFVAFFRDPYQQVLAHYHFLRRNPQREHPEVKIFHEAKMSVLEYIEWSAFHDHQTQFLGSLSIDDLAFVGLSSQYAKSLELFKMVFGYDLGKERFENVNTELKNGEYHVDSDVRAAVKKYRAADLELYARAVEIFDRQTSTVAA